MNFPLLVCLGCIFASSCVRFFVRFMYVFGPFLVHFRSRFIFRPLFDHFWSFLVQFLSLFILLWSIFCPFVCSFFVHFRSIFGPFIVHFLTFLGSFLFHFWPIFGPFSVHFYPFVCPFLVHVVYDFPPKKDKNFDVETVTEIFSGLVGSPPDLKVVKDLMDVALFLHDSTFTYIHIHKNCFYFSLRNGASSLTWPRTKSQGFGLSKSASFSHDDKGRINLMQKLNLSVRLP